MCGSSRIVAQQCQTSRCTEISAQTLVRAAFTRRRISGSGGSHSLAAINPADCGLSGSAVPGALTGVCVGSQAACGGDVALLCDAGLLIAGGTSFLR